MNKYNGLLEQIASDCNILRGTGENEILWEERIVYSVTGRMSYAASFDNSENEEATSIVHVKRRMQNILESYIELYPEIKTYFNIESIINEIYNILLNTGQFYHTRNHITPAMPQSSLQSGIVFTRGMSLSQDEYVSGLGTYLFDDHLKTYPIDVKDMFQLQKKDLLTIWEDVVSNAKWDKLSINQPAEFLRIKPPYSRGYWEDKPTPNCISICRIGEKGNQLYYLYKLNGSEILACQFPSWAVDNYTIISNACLSASGTLPTSIYRYDGDLVFLNIKYLMPSSEMNFIKLYSWPDLYIDFPNDFHRIFTADVFEAAKSILKSEGYSFKEE